MNLKIYQIDAFAQNVFEGNPAAVIKLENWIDDNILMKIANENNLSETAYIVENENKFELRWFTPISEVDMCGHATLASAYVLYNELGYLKNYITFATKSGELVVYKEGDLFNMDFPLLNIEESNEYEVFQKIFGIKPLSVYESKDYLVVFDNEDIIKKLNPDISLMKKLNLRGVIVTSKSNKYDFICRFFAPKQGVIEDPVTGSAYTQLLTYWNRILNKTKFFSKQISTRGGEVNCEIKNERCIIKGSAVKYMEGNITI